MNQLTLYAVICAVLAFTIIDCKHTTEPPPPGLDSTSHVVVWKTDTIGVGNSIVRDIAIIDENNVWAAGEFYLRDSSGNIDEKMYNVLRWDGTQWTPLRLPFTYNGQEYMRGGYAVFGFAANDIWLAADAAERWNGQALLNVNLGITPFSPVYRFWGTSSSDLYAVGSPGRLSRYDGTKFTEIPTGVQSYFCDITGNGAQLYVSSYYYDNQIRPSGVFSYKQGKFEFLFPDPADNSKFQALRDAFGLWLSPQGTLWAVGGPFVFQPLRTHDPVFANDHNFSCIRGISDSDVWVAGGSPSVVHFNGQSWHKYTDAELGTTGLAPLYKTIAVKGNLVAMGGWLSFANYAIVTIGKRLP